MMETVANKIDDIEDFYNEFSAKYDRTILGKDCDAQHFQVTRQLFERYRHEEGSILDVGCGTGILKDSLGSRFTYTGIDISEKMLSYARQRDYQIIHQKIQDALPQIPSRSFEYVICLSALYFIKDITQILHDMRRIARQSILLSLEELPDEYIRDLPCPVYDHTNICWPAPVEDFYILGWTSPTLGIPIRMRMIYCKP